MTDSPTLELPDEPESAPSDDEGAGDVPPPVPPGDPEAWYAPDVRAQYRVASDAVATVRETAEGFAYDVREPSLRHAERDLVDRVEDYFADANLEPPRTREAVRERFSEGFPGSTSAWSRGSSTRPPPSTAASATTCCGISGRWVT